MNKVILTISCLCICFNVGTQTPFNKLYDFGLDQANAYTIFERSGYYYIAGQGVPKETGERNVFIAKIDLLGNVIKSRIWDNPKDDNEITFLTSNQTVSQLEDSFIIGYIDFPDCFLEIDYNLENIELIKCINLPNNNLNVTAQVIKNDTLINITNNVDQRILITLLDLSTNEHTIKDITPETDDKFQMLNLLEDEKTGKLIILGIYFNADQKGLYIFEIDNEYNLIKEFYPLDSIDGNWLLSDSFFDSNGDLIVLLYESKSDFFGTLYKPFIVKLDKNFDVTWSIPTDNQFTKLKSINFSITESFDNKHYLFVGNNSPELSPPIDTAFVGKISHDGSILWKKKFADPNLPFDNKLHSIVATSDGFYTAVGTRQVHTTNDSLDSYNQTWLIKFNDEGEIVNVGSTSSTDNFPEISFNIYPNPSSNTLVVENSFSKEFTYDIFNVVGQFKSHGLLNKNNKTTIDLVNYESGTYIITFSDKGGLVKTQRFVVP
ncbi:MAG: T9SS type A sorting domain-containing protein [Saprospiraceae bacterium]|nr:T9SS type A sorting domain-containing protein [Bacteroidia bacterium]NNL91320.1 T9SS type A sorting domain-containing protein [Saprospiraceae bacterium]